MKTLTVSTISVLSLILLAGAATAAPKCPAVNGPGPGMGYGQGMGQMLPPMLEKYDTNGDGKISKDEADAAATKAYADAGGTDSAGVSIQQFEPYFWKEHREMMVRAFQRLDRDGDGKISADEMKAGMERMGDRFDGSMPGPMKMMGRFGPEGHGGWGGPRADRDGQGQGWGGMGQGWGWHHGPRNGYGPCAMTPPSADDAAPNAPAN